MDPVFCSMFLSSVSAQSIRSSDGKTIKQSPQQLWKPSCYSRRSSSTAAGSRCSGYACRKTGATHSQVQDSASCNIRHSNGETTCNLCSRPGVLPVTAELVHVGGVCSVKHTENHHDSPSSVVSYNTCEFLRSRLTHRYSACRTNSEFEYFRGRYCLTKDPPPSKISRFHRSVILAWFQRLDTCRLCCSSFQVVSSTLRECLTFRDFAAFFSAFLDSSRLVHFRDFSTFSFSWHSTFPHCDPNAITLGGC